MQEYADLSDAIMANQLRQLITYLNILSAGNFMDYLYTQYDYVRLLGLVHVVF
ncbi:MAG: hypothetical protein GWP34_03990 [Alphaproteobacteria bacterium]|nr:hypothetical protein [Alphaproteobacteria bacterium]